MTHLTDSEEAVPPEAVTVLHQIAAVDGYVSNLLRLLAYAPQALGPFIALDQYCRRETQLSPRHRALCMLVAMRDVHYCWVHQAPLARAAGISEEQLTLIREGRIPRDLDDPDRALSDYAFEITACRRIPPRVQEAVTLEFSSREIVDIALLTSFSMAVAALVMGLDVDVEPPEVLAHELALYQAGLPDVG
jgi:alkylhydroperoxidase family enzyme